MMTLAMISAGCSSDKNSGTPALNTGYIDAGINPGDDFYRYVNNGWIKEHTPIPEEYTRYGAFDELSEANEKNIKTIIEKAAADKKAGKGSVSQKIRDFYNAGMDTAAIEARGYEEIVPYLKLIGSMQDKNEIAKVNAELQTIGLGAFFSAGVGPDPKQADMNIMHLAQGGLGLPDRDDYFGENKEMWEAYKKHICKMFILVGVDESAAIQKAENVFSFERSLAESSLTNVELRNPDTTYNMMSKAELKQLSPSYDWDAYFNVIGVPEFSTMNVAEPHFFEALSSSIDSYDFEVIMDYMSWKVIHSSASRLCSALDVENFNFYGKFLYGQESQLPRWRRILNSTSHCLGEAIGQLYVEEYFPASAKERMENLVANLKVALGQRIEVLDWMSDETKVLALDKLETISVKVGYPNKWKDYSNYDVCADSYFRNVCNAIAFANKEEMAELGKPVDKEKWFMTPQTVNAYYSPEMNEIVFPAGIMQPPFFNQNADDAINYGGIGVVIGHEMTHGFDDQGRKYDKKGNLNDWWTEEDATRFNERAQQLVKLFGSFELRGNFINGELTLGENIADLGGLNISWDAYQMTDEAKHNKAIDGFTPAQRFYMSYATVWRNVIRDKALERRIKEDVHSPAEARVNRALFSVDNFYKAFDIDENAKLYIAPDDRAKIW